MNPSYSLNYLNENLDSGILERDTSIKQLADFSNAYGIWLDTIVLERNSMHDLLKLVEKTGGHCEFIPSYFSTQDPNHQDMMSSALQNFLCRDTRTMVQFRVVTHRTINYTKVHRIFDDELELRQEISLSVIRENDSISGHYSFDAW